MAATKSQRQSELDQFIEQALAADPALREALGLAEMSQAEYARAIAATQTVKIFTSTSSNPGSDKNAIANERTRGNPPPKQ